MVPYKRGNFASCINIYYVYILEVKKKTKRLLTGASKSDLNLAGKKHGLDKRLDLSNIRQVRNRS